MAEQVDLVIPPTSREGTEEIVDWLIDLEADRDAAPMTEAYGISRRASLDMCIRGVYKTLNKTMPGDSPTHWQEMALRRRIELSEQENGAVALERSAT